MSRLNASAQVTGATGALVRSRNVAQCFRAGAGVYHIVFPPDQNLNGSEYHFDLTPVGAAARTLQLGNVDEAPPGGANAPAGARSVQVLAFDAAGAAADADFLFSAQRV